MKNRRSACGENDCNGILKKIWLIIAKKKEKYRECRKCGRITSTFEPIIFS